MSSIDDKVIDAYSISVKGPGLAMDKSVGPEIARAVVLMMMGGAPTDSFGKIGSNGPGQVTGSQDPLSRTSRRLSLREFMDETGATKNAEKIVAIAEYIHAQEGKETFSWDDIKSRFRSAAEPEPGNFARDFAAVMKSAWAAEDSAVPNSYYVTQTGRRALDARFGSKAKKPAGASESQNDAAPAVSRRRTGGSKTANWRMVDALLDESGRRALKEFFDLKAPRNQNEQVAVLAYKLRELTTRDAFDGNEIHTAFQIVGVKTPGNLTGVFGNMTASGLGRVIEKRFTQNFKGDDIVKHVLPAKDDKK